jgi:N-hydroxyarylamine O-acetyltransferase
MEPASYLARIDYRGPFEPTLETLRGLHAAHMYAVPFENLDIVPLHRPIRLDEASLWRKIVEERRGGFCYELNGMFAWLLKQAGFEVSYQNARVFSRDGKLGIDFDHLALLVRLPDEDGLWLADVGFGDSFTEPLQLEEGEQAQGLRAYRLQDTGDGYITWQRNYDGTWEREYFFDLLPRSFPADYEAGCTYHQRSPASSFTRSSVISRATPRGRISLQEDRLIITEDGNRKDWELRPGEWPARLKEHFGIVLEQPREYPSP